MAWEVKSRLASEQTVPPTNGTYDARSRLTGITRSATDKVNWTYNTAGLVTSEVTTIPQVTSALGASSVTSTMNYAYDTAQRLHCPVHRHHALRLPR
ncbi:MAG: hypothetical protein MUC83_17970 [Pirellula sp.]|nr:hypothetical protein [Pirellula sp.]